MSTTDMSIDSVRELIQTRIDQIRSEIGPKMTELAQMEKALAALAAPPKRRGRPKKNPTA